MPLTRVKGQRRAGKRGKSDPPPPPPPAWGRIGGTHTDGPSVHKEDGPAGAKLRLSALFLLSSNPPTLISQPHATIFDAGQRERRLFSAAEEASKQSLVAVPPRPLGDVQTAVPDAALVWPVPPLHHPPCPVNGSVYKASLQPLGPMTSDVKSLLAAGDGEGVDGFV